MKRHLTFALSACTILFLSSPASAARPSLFKIDIHTKNVYDGKHPDISYSQLRMSIGNEDISFREYLDKYAKHDDTHIDQIWEFSIGLSSVPLLAKGPATKELNIGIDEKIHFLKGQTELEIPTLRSQAVTKFLAQNPALSTAYLAGDATAVATIKAVSAQIEDTIRSTIDQKFVEAAQQAKAKVSKRVDELQIETMVQEVAVRYARKGKSYLSYFQLGKFRVNGAGDVNDLDETAIEQLRPINDEVVRIIGAANTTGVNIGIITNYELGTKDLSVRADLYVFHERSPFISANDYVGRIATMSDEEYERHKDILDINAGLFRVMAKMDKWSAYFTVAQNDRLQSWYGAGITYAFTKKFSFILNTYMGDRVEASKALSTYLTYELSQSTSVYAGVLVTRDAYTPTISTNGVYDKVEAVAGLRYKISQPIFWGFFSKPQVGLEVYAGKRNFASPIDQKNQKQDDYGVRLGFSAKLGLTTSLEAWQERRNALANKLLKKRSQGKDITKLERQIREADTKIKAILAARARH